jgi:hypothetical protein
MLLMWMVRSAVHLNAMTECELWQWGVGAADRLKQWRLAPTLRKRRRPTLVVPDVGCTFMQANPGQRNVRCLFCRGVQRARRQNGRLQCAAPPTSPRGSQRRVRARRRTAGAAICS